MQLDIPSTRHPWAAPSCFGELKPIEDFNSPLLCNDEPCKIRSPCCAFGHDLRREIRSQGSVGIAVHVIRDWCSESSKLDERSTVAFVLFEMMFVLGMGLKVCT
jgi:hypothetical protein